MPPENELADVPVVDHISDSKALQLAAKTFINFGCLVIKSVFENNFIEQTYAEYMKEHRDHFLEGGLNNDLCVGDRRIMIPLHLKGVFNSPDFYANPRVYPLMNFLLGNDVILNSLGSVVSLPGAKEQHIHIDYPNIYTALETYNSDMSWIGKAPPYAVTMGIPLIPMNPETGCTRFWSGSHLDPHYSLDNPIDLYADAGSCVLFDYRIAHCGLANTSQQIRPLLYNVYSRPWFRDSLNFHKHDPLVVSSELVSQIPEEHRHLVDWMLDAKTRGAINA